MPSIIISGIHFHFDSTVTVEVSPGSISVTANVPEVRKRGIFDDLRSNTKAHDRLKAITSTPTAKELSWFSTT